MVNSAFKTNAEGELRAQLLDSASVNDGDLQITMGINPGEGPRNSHSEAVLQPMSVCMRVTGRDV